VSTYYNIFVLLILLYLRTAKVPNAAAAVQATGDTPAAVTGQHTSAYVSIRQHTSACVSIRAVKAAGDT
jgi:hypothetical protein